MLPVIMGIKQLVMKKKTNRYDENIKRLLKARKIRVKSDTYLRIDSNGKTLYVIEFR